MAKHPTQVVCPKCPLIRSLECPTLKLRFRLPLGKHAGRQNLHSSAVLANCPHEGIWNASLILPHWLRHWFSSRGAAAAAFEEVSRMCESEKQRRVGEQLASELQTEQITKVFLATTVGHGSLRINVHRSPERSPQLSCNEHFCVEMNFCVA